MCVKDYIMCVTCDFVYVSKCLAVQPVVHGPPTRHSPSHIALIVWWLDKNKEADQWGFRRSQASHAG